VDYAKNPEQPQVVSQAEIANFTPLQDDGQTRGEKGQTVSKKQRHHVYIYECANEFQETLRR